MKRFVSAMLAVASILVWSASIAESNRLQVIAEFPGSSLKWVRIAEPEFERKGLDVDNYIITVVEEDDSVAVMLRSPETVGVPGLRGSTGKFPEYEVEINKKDKKVIRSNYIR